MAEILKVIFQKFDPVIAALTVIIGWLIWKAIEKMFKEIISTQLLQGIKIQAMYDTIQKYSQNGAGLHLRNRESELIEEQKLMKDK